MSNPKWEIGPVKLVDGFDAQIFLFDEIRKVYLGAYRLPGGGLYALEWREDGSPIDGTKGFRFVPPPKKTVRVNRWLNVDADGSVWIYKLRSKAEADSHHDRIACFEIDIEVTEGEGL